MARTRNRFTTRSLLICVVLGAFCGLIGHASRILGLAIQTSLPWLSFPAPLPWFLGVSIAAVLVARRGAAALTGLVGAIVGFGGLILCGALVIELAFWFSRRRGPLVSTIAGALVGLMSFGFMHLYAEFLLLPLDLRMLGLVVRLGLCAAYGLLGWWIAKALQRAGVGNDRSLVEDDDDVVGAEQTPKAPPTSAVDTDPDGLAE